MTDAPTAHASPWTAALKKVALSATALALFALVLATFGASETRADITWLDPVAPSGTDRFETALHDLGHSDIGTYELNGNRVYFSTTVADASPTEVAHRYQRALVQQGLNDEVFDGIDPDTLEQRLRTGITGGLTPLAWTPEHIALAGAIPSNYAESDAELLANFADASSRSDLFRGHRYIEISRQPDAAHTRIVASWSDEDFDLDRMIPDDDLRSLSADLDLPICPGCTRLMQFADHDNPAQLELSFLSPLTQDDTREYYLHHLRKQGWQRHPLGEGLDRLTSVANISLPSGHSDRFHRSGHTLTATYQRDPHNQQTLVHLSQSDR